MSPAPPTPLDFREISERLQRAALPDPEDLDLVVGIATGGVVPASLVAHRLGLGLALIRLNYRAPDNTPRRPRPELLGAAPDVRGKRVLLVDDVVVTGATLARAAGALPAASIRTLAFKGRPGSADVVLFPELRSCVAWPWNPGGPEVPEGPDGASPASGAPRVTDRTGSGPA